MSRKRTQWSADDCVVVSFSDRHAASKLAPINPDTRLYDLNGGEIKLNPTAVGQMVWKDFGVKWPAEVQHIADGRPLHFIDGGDPTQGNKHTEELHATSPAHQVELSKGQLEPWLALPNVKSVRFVAGTGSHEFGEGSATQSLAALVRAEYPKITDVTAHYHQLATIYGVRFDLAHHGPNAPKQAWQTDTAAQNYARGIVIDDLLDHKDPPDVILRGHVHTPTMSLINVRGRWAWMIVAPSLQYPNDYARKAARSPARFSYGVTVFDIRGGKIHGFPIRLWRTVDTRTEVVTSYD